jgi:hypothetical protein
LQDSLEGRIIEDTRRETDVYEELTAFIPRLMAETSYGEPPSFVYEEGPTRNSISADTAEYSSTVDELIKSVHIFVRAHPEEGFGNYQGILEKSGIKWEWDSMTSCDPSAPDGTTVVALIFAAFRADRFCDGVLMGYLESGYIMRWLQRLKEIDESK